MMYKCINLLLKAFVIQNGVDILCIKRYLLFFKRSV